MAHDVADIGCKLRVVATAVAHADVFEVDGASSVAIKIEITEGRVTHHQQIAVTDHLQIVFIWHGLQVLVAIERC